MKEKKRRIMGVTAAVLAIAAVALLSYFSFRRAGREQPEDIPTVVLESAADWQAMIDQAVPGVDCWGDSITEGYLGEGENYPATLAVLIDSELIEPIRKRSGCAELAAPVVRNMGVSSETTLDIAGRRGAIPWLVRDGFTIPADRSEVELDFGSSERDVEVRPIRAGDGSYGKNGVNPVTIAGVEGELIIYYDFEADRSRYRFARSAPGEAVAVAPGEVIVSASADRYQDDICVVMMGANGNYTEPKDLAEQFRRMTRMQRDDRWLLIGMGHREEDDGLLTDEEKRALSDAFGEKFISLQDWMAQNGIDTANRFFDAGLVPTAVDEVRIAQGHTPASLLNEDDLHYTPLGYRVIGRMVYEEMDRRGYFDELRALGETLAEKSGHLPSGN